MNKEEERLISYNYNEFGQEFGDLIVDIRNERDKYKEVLDKIKEYCNNRLQYYNEMKRDYIKEFDGYAENDNENILELLEEIKNE